MSDLFIQFIAVMTVVGSIAIKLVGIPDQIRMLLKTNEVGNISLLNYWLSLITYFFWTIHGMIKQDLVIIIAQSLGVITTGILLAIIFRIKRKKKQHGMTIHLSDENKGY
uniref:SemiSWEET family transporter n=1 Tax=Pedobacter schmidteae TaxID=2201271 RepID=UPI000EB233EE|nr:SemiSWEET family transporter [Pedobacter schmidteae]